MARRFHRGLSIPDIGTFLVIAIVIAIPVTIWAFNNVSTQTKQYASETTSCESNGGICTNSACSQDYNQIPGVCDTDATQKCCKPIKFLNPPIESSGYSFCSLENKAGMHITWEPVAGADSYKFYFKVKREGNFSRLYGPYIINQSKINIPVMPDCKNQSGNCNYDFSTTISWQVESANQFTTSLKSKEFTKPSTIVCL